MCGYDNFINDKKVQSGHCHLSVVMVPFFLSFFSSIPPPFTFAQQLPQIPLHNKHFLFSLPPKNTISSDANCESLFNFPVNLKKWLCGNRRNKNTQKS